ncbi:MAG: LacI family DNA-binding transcriptional regulator [Niameybacter sp.]
MNIYDIAERAGVSIATVSRVLNNSPNVSAKTKEKILRVMENEGYTPNIFARGLGLNSMKIIGVLCTDVADIYYAKAVSVIESSLRKHGFDSMLYCTGSDLEGKSKAMESLLSKRVDALILVGSTFKEKEDNSHIEKIAQHMPVIIINGLIELDNTYCIICDEYNAMVDNVCKLHAQGNTNIAYLYDVETYSSSQKLSGYKKGLEKCNLSFNKDFVIKIPLDLQTVESYVDNLLNLNPPPSAILVSEDLLAIGAIKAITKRGYQIPKDISIIGFNNSILCECVSPTLSSIDNMVEVLCSQAINTLTEVLDGKSVPDKLVISSKLIERETFTL